MLTAALVLGGVVVLAAASAGAYFAFGRSEGIGVASPEQAVDGFLTAMYKTADADTASEFVCASARDLTALRARLRDLRSFDARLKSPSYSWSAPTVESRGDQSAEVSVRIKLKTSDDKVSEQPLRILTVKTNGWLVCEINSAA